MATVFDNSMTAHAWAHGNGEARSHNGNMYARGAVLFSYGSHFPIGIRFPYDAPGGAAFVMNADSYSISTSRHQLEARRAIHGPSVYVPGLGDIWRSLEASTSRRGDADDAKRVRQHLESRVCADMTEEGVGLVLELIGSRADPANVLARANRARVEEKKRREKLERKRLVDYARFALTFPLSSYDGTGSNPRDLNPTHMARAWKAAKASGWSDKRLKALRAREKALRANLERVRARGQRVRINAHKRAMLATLRLCSGSRPVADAFKRGSVEARRDLAAALSRLAAYQPATLGIPSARWKEAADSYADRAREGEQVKRRAMARHAEYQHANALELWRAGELPTHRLPHNFRRFDSALVRAVHVTRDDSGDITGGELQTSGGARVPLTRAILLFRFLKKTRERFAQDRPGADGRAEEAWRANGQRARVGSFDVELIYGDGSFKAGCHFIQWDESRALAESLGVFDVTPSADIVRDSERA